MNDTELPKDLQKMKNNRRDWTMDEIILLSRNFDIEHRTTNGSHHVFSHNLIRNNLSIPNHKDIHPKYIGKLVRFIEEILNFKKK